MKLLRYIFLFLVLMMPIFADAQTQLNEAHFRIYDAKGNAANLNRVVEALKTADVVFLGEQHDDPTGHALQLAIFRQVFEQYGKERAVVLSLEMFERDDQLVLDEYLADLINENNFINASRVWNNYNTDYRPLVEFAKANKLAVIAANAPRRYVNRVSRLGRSSLDALSPQAKSWLAPLPYAQASEAYARKFNALMGAMGAHSSNILDSQSLWDATMAHSIAEQLKKQPKSLVVNINGAFHSENRLGAPEHLLRYRSSAKAIVVTMKSPAHFPAFDKAKDEDAGDFVILTDPKLPRTFDVRAR